MRKHGTRSRGIAVLIAVAMCGMHGCLPDMNEDGVRVLALIGDSNTASWCWLPGPELEWCFDGGCPPGCVDNTTGGKVIAQLPNVVVRNYAVPGTGWQRGGEYSCEAQIAAALAESPAPDGFVLACGSNNLSMSASEMAGHALSAVSDIRANGALAFVATVPRRKPATSDSLVAEVNDLLMAAHPPSQTIDLHTGFDPLDLGCYWPDGVHYTEVCAQTRADRIVGVIGG